MKTSKSGLFLFELIIVIFLFTLSSAICINIFAKAFIYSTDSENLTESSLKVMAVAETFKDGDGDAYSDADAIVAALNSDDNTYEVSLNGDTGDYGRFTINFYYDKNWQNVSKENSVYNLVVSAKNENINDKVICANISVSDKNDTLLDMKALKIGAN